ncbi:MAG TPA: polysaccharide biosynthesis/export family protein, partial [Candidatus Limnocylindrales bacterium]|nr:polysaccharide biosynthesis/export family protein [Candidatus Limnocylindrales bacterium]
MSESKLPSHFDKEERPARDGVLETRHGYSKMKNRCGLMIAIVLVAVPLCWSQEQRKDTPDSSATKEQLAGANPTPGFGERNPRYQLCPGDVLELHFEFTPEFNQSNIAVQPDGFANLTGVGDVHVAG